MTATPGLEAVTCPCCGSSDVYSNALNHGFEWCEKCDCTWREPERRAPSAQWLSAPEGWRFYTADFSLLPGRVMLVRDAAGVKQWHALSDADKERDDGHPLYIAGHGMRLQAAFEKACASAAAEPPLSSPPETGEAKP